MAVQSEIFSTEYGVRSFASTKHIGQKQNMAVWLKRRSDNIWVQLSISNYELINNSAVLTQAPNSTTYSQVEIRVADTHDELGSSQSEISIVAGLYDEIVALNGIKNDITTVAGMSVDVTTVSSNILDINSVATNIVPNLAEILQSDTNATIATTKAAEASASATSASNSATTATNQATIATTKASEAAASATSASNSATSASGSASTATTKASEALASQVAAAASASTASTKASEANTSAGNAASSASTASTQAGIATTKATEASNSASAAATSASTATTKADSATASASAASSSATLASTKAAEADADATSAANSATSASNSATSASSSANTATTKANEASTSASLASVSANNASTSETMAYKWSSNPVDTIVETDKYSAFHWATKAQQYASSVDPSNLVHKTGNETIAGVKTFSSSPIVPTPTTDFQATTARGTNITVNVGTGQTYTTINQALEYLSGFYPLYKKSGITATINLKAGFVMNEQVLVSGLNLGWITIVGEDAETIITHTALTTALNEGYPAFGVYKGGTSPVIGQLFRFNVEKVGGNKHGLMTYGAGSSADVLSGKGFIGAGARGIYAANCSTINANFANASNAGANGIYATTGSTINAHFANASNAGANGIYASTGSTINAYYAIVQDQTTGTSRVMVQDGAHIEAYSINTTGGTVPALSQTANTLTVNGIIFK